MTKAKLARLIELSNRTAFQRPMGTSWELEALQAEFAAWEPEKIRETEMQIIEAWAMDRAGKITPELDQAIMALHDLLAEETRP